VRPPAHCLCAPQGISPGALQGADWGRRRAWQKSEWPAIAGLISIPDSCGWRQMTEGSQVRSSAVTKVRPIRHSLSSVFTRVLVIFRIGTDPSMAGSVHGSLLQGTRVPQPAGATIPPISVWTESS